MAACPKRRISRTRRDKRRTHWKISPSVKDVSNYGDPCRPHRVCPSCGFYRGRQYLDSEVIS